MKFALTICIVFLFPCGVLRGENEIRMNGIEHRMNNLETSSGNRPMHPVTPCAGPKVRDGMDLNLSAALLSPNGRGACARE